MENSHKDVPLEGNKLATETVDNISYADVLVHGKTVIENPSNNNSDDPNDNIESQLLDTQNSSAKVTSNEASEIEIESDSNSLSDKYYFDNEREECDLSDILDCQTLEENNVPLLHSHINNIQNCTKTVNDSSGTLETTNDEDPAEVSSVESYSDEGEESDTDESTSIADTYPAAMKWQFRQENPELPETVTVLQAKSGGKVYLVGTAHFSLESQEDVSKTICATQPDIVMMELCKSRVNILSLDEETILEESRNMNFQKIRAAIEQNGLMQGVLYLLLLNISAHLTKQLGMAPGGEFRRAYTEAKKVPGCLVHLGDRPIHITLQRALATLSWWQKLRAAWYMLFKKEPISKQEVERCKQRDLLEETLAEMTGEFPGLTHVFVKERDIYLTYSLQTAALPMPSHGSSGGAAPTVVVGVVGIGHVPGIIENWDKVTENDIPPILSIPEPSKTSKFIRKAVKYSVVCLAAYGCYKVLPKSISKKPFELLDSVKLIFK